MSQSKSLDAAAEEYAKPIVGPETMSSIFAMQAFKAGALWAYANPREDVSEAISLVYALANSSPTRGTEFWDLQDNAAKLIASFRQSKGEG